MLSKMTVSCIHPTFLVMLTCVRCIAGILVPRHGSSTPVPATGTASISLWIIISVIGGITLVAVGLVIAILCYRKCSKKQQPLRQNVCVPLLVIRVLYPSGCWSTAPHAVVLTLMREHYYCVYLYLLCRLMY